MCLFLYVAHYIGIQNGSQYYVYFILSPQINTEEIQAVYWYPDFRCEPYQPLWLSCTLCRAVTASFASILLLQSISSSATKGIGISLITCDTEWVIAGIFYGSNESENKW